MKPYRCLVFGLGQVGRQACRYLLRDGIEIVAAYSRSSHLGDDLGEVVGLSKVGIRVQASSSFQAHKGLADIALFFTTSSLADLLGEARQCLENGIDVLTIAEDALYPWNHSPALAAELDAIARSGGASLVGGGVNDVAMTHLPAVLGAFTSGVKRIRVECAGDFGQFGAALLDSLPLGLDQTGFDAWVAAAAAGPHGASIAAQSLEALLSLTDQVAASVVEIDLQPTWADTDLRLSTGASLSAGSTSGFIESARVRSTAGVELEIHLIGKVFEPTDKDYLQIDVQAEQPISLRIGPLPGVPTTAALVLSRIGDVLAAAPGLQSIDRLPCSRLRLPDRNK
ncbi:hypothetical protein [Pseudomonas citronellolis]|uniref:hypothetical protein n=1 Tax=Pseudomonas citronellolis TaxID=53408 RepID=UPI0007185F0A|nr:hypothetical protein [Pseudomonas citronellolis]KRV76331.1 hypothetical protein AO742_12395 [Pseudomonas citronellolis]KRW79634.1 hypothetical protein AO738_13870 [Pseudomonas citronellolis]